jgi:hypothetical protein
MAQKFNAPACAEIPAGVTNRPHVTFLREACMATIGFFRSSGVLCPVSMRIGASGA